MFQFSSWPGVLFPFPFALGELSCCTPLPLAACPTPPNTAQVAQHLSNLPKSPRSAPQNARSVGRGEEDSKLGPARRALHGKLMTFCLSCLQTGLICMYALGIISPRFRACGSIPASSSERFPPAVPAVTGRPPKPPGPPSEGRRGLTPRAGGSLGAAGPPSVGNSPGLWGNGSSITPQPPPEAGFQVDLPSPSFTLVLHAFCQSGSQRAG